MVCLHGALPDSKASGLTLESELVVLFGRAIVARATRTEVADLELDAPFIERIADTADHLLKLKGDPAAQREVVSKLTEAQALALCMWIMDTGMEE